MNRTVSMKMAAIAALAALALAATMLAGCSQGQQVSNADAIDPAEVSAAVDEGKEQAAQAPAPAAETAKEGQQGAADSAAQPSETPAAPVQPAADGNAQGKLVVIDPGHQGQGDSTQEPVGPGASETKARVTSGASGSYSGVDEHVVNLQVGLKLRDYLESQGIRVIMVRETADVNISNSERAAIANDNGAALFVRLHCDSSDSSSAEGFSTLVPGYNEWTGPIVEQSRVAGEYVHAAALAATGAADAGVIERTDLSGFNWCEVPTVLCEMGFMSNEHEDLLLSTDEYQQKLAVGIGNGVIQYLSTL